jgi:hypothetical protein
MADEETKDGIKVSDKRRFRVDAGGNVVSREDSSEASSPAESTAPPPAAEPGAPADLKAEREQFEQECEPCQSDYADLPPIDFLSFVFSFSTSTMMCLGLLPNPDTQERFVDLGMAKQNIDILGMLQEKTRGNLTKEEEDFLTASLYDLRLRFVEACRSSTH